MSTLRQDVQYAIRMLVKQPAFTVIAILTLALGIGINSAIFSVVNGILLRTLPMPDPQELVIVSSTVRRENVERRVSSYPDFLDWREQNPVFESMSAQADTTLTLINEGQSAIRIEVEFVSASYFQIFGAKLHQGRAFLASEDQYPSTDTTCVLSYNSWQQRFAADQSIVGKTIRLDGKPVRVTGILTEEFQGFADDIEIWLPISSYAMFDSPIYLEYRGRRWLNVIARLKNDVTIPQAQSAMNTIAARLEDQYHNTNENYGALVVSLTDELVGDTRSPVLFLFGAVMFVLLIACTNVANLMLVRTASRRKELAIRTALGASRSRMLKQLITESVVLSLFGGILGLFLGVWCTHLISRYSPVILPSYMRPEMDVTVFVFTIVISILTGLAIGTVAALRVTAQAPQESLKSAASQTTDTRTNKNTRSILVITETALAMVLLIGAGLMIRSLNQLQSIPLGFGKERILTMKLSLPTAKYMDGKDQAFRDLLVERIKGLPGIDSAALTTDIPLGDRASATVVGLEGMPPGDGYRIYRHSVTSDFFNTMNIPLIKGRAISTGDQNNAPFVVVVSRKMADRFWPNQDPIGKRLKIGGTGSENPWITVVGVVGDVKQRALVANPIENPDDPDLYFSIAQFSEMNPILLVRTNRDSTSIADSVRREIQMLDPEIPLYEATTMSEVVSQQTASARFSTFLMTIFGALALLLACIGLYGVLSYAVTQRTREIGLRIALGAKRADVFRMVLSQALLWMALGLAAGIIAALSLSRILQSQLYEISGTDPITYSAITFILLFVAFLATSIPARRATRVDPMVALRYE